MAQPLVKNETTSIQQNELPDHHYAIAASDTSEIVNDEFVLNLCGLSKVPQGNFYKLVRVRRPTFTYEGAQELMSYLYMGINRMTGRSTVTAQELLNWNVVMLDTNSDWLMEEGFHRLVSNQAWKICLELARPIISDDGHVEEAHITTLGKTESFPKNRWYTEHGIRWEYNMPFNDDMLDIIKENYNLKTESHGQDFKLMSVLMGIQEFHHLGLARSKDNLTLDHEKVIYKEQVTGPTQIQPEQQEGKIAGALRAIRNFLPGGG